MSTATTTALITPEQFFEMHFDGPVELVRGEIVELTRPDQSHGSVCSEVSFAITSWARKSNAGRVTTNDSGILTDPVPGTVRGADVAFFATTQLTGGKLPRGQKTLIPVLCVEVLSPSNSWAEIRCKIEEYLTAGVHEVWVVDPELRTVERFRSESGSGGEVKSRMLHEHEMLTSLELPGFSVPVADFFAGVE